MVSLGWKLKMPKTYQKPFCENIRVVLWKTPVEKTSNIRESDDLENRPSCKGYSPCKAIAFAKWSVWVKNWKCQKYAKNHSTRTLKLFCAKNRWKNHKLFENWENVENLPSCKGYRACKGYSLCKMVSLAQKLKMAKTISQEH